MVEHILSPDVNESAAVFVGRLVSSLILHANAHIGEYSEVLLLAVLNKLQASTRLTVSETLVLAFARLINVDTALVIDFLAKHK